MAFFKVKNKIVFILISIYLIYLYINISITCTNIIYCYLLIIIIIITITSNQREKRSFDFSIEKLEWKEWVWNDMLSLQFLLWFKFYFASHPFLSHFTFKLKNSFGCKICVLKNLINLNILTDLKTSSRSRAVREEWMYMGLSKNW